MTKTDIDIFFKKIEEIQKAKKSLEKLSIEWEMDLKKIDLSVLRSQIGISLNDPNQKVWLDTFHLGSELFVPVKEPQTVKNFLIEKPTLDLISFIENGNKIIPPLYIKPYNFCGETYEYTETGDFYRADGGHRVFVSKMIGLTEIPIIKIERVNRFSFPIEKWEFGYEGNNLKAKSKLKPLEIEIDMEVFNLLNDISMVDNILVIAR